MQLKPAKGGVTPAAGVPMGGMSLADFMKSKMPAGGKKNKPKFKRSVAGYKAG